ncbi:MAG: hypothetical protein HY270_17005 [Deltaproteobacteria bacterium]|nr:hypothetical protein [Deltaproteobacteria bacterium]
MSASKLPAAGRGEAILTVPAFGRYAVLVHSSQGTGLQLMDRLAGPSEVQGAIGKVDGRIDQFLDRGTYKVVTHGHPKAVGDAHVEAHAFRELNPTPPLLIEHKLLHESLGDFEQRSYWLDIRERQQVILEAAGRNLTDLRLWSNGNWLVDLAPAREVIEPTKGQPLLTCRMTAALDPGLYLLTAYGGFSQPWANDSREHPFYLRSGIPKRPEVARSHHAVSPFGIDRWLVPGDATYFRLELPEARPATLSAGLFNEQHPFDDNGTHGNISKTSLVPATWTEISRHAWHVVTVSGAAGQPYVLQHFNAGERYAGIGRQWSLPQSGRYWISTVHSGDPDDSVDATAIVMRIPRLWSETQHSEPLVTQMVVIDQKSPWVRRANLLDTLTLFVQIKQTGKYQVLARGPKARFRFEPFLLQRPHGYQEPDLQPAGFVWDLDAGYYVLTAVPEQRGVIDMAIVGGETPVSDQRFTQLLNTQDVVHAAAQFPQLSIDFETNWLYKFFLNFQPEVQVGMVLRSLPTDLTDALPVVQYAGETIAVPFSENEPGTLRAEAEDGTLLDVSLDSGPAKPTQNVKEGQHSATIRWEGPKRVHYSLVVEPRRLQSDTPLPPLPDPSRATPPKLPVLSSDQPQFFELDRSSGKSFLVRADSPALYRIQSTGLLATEGNLRTRTVVSFDRQSQNGVGRNFFLQQYLREGDYQVTVATLGDSRGHLGLTLDKTPMIDGGTIHEGAPARITLPAGNAAQYTFVIREAGTYRLRSLGVGKTFRGRIEDDAGWPIDKPNLALDVTRELDPGTYHVVSLPEPVAGRRQTLLERVREAPTYKGHGPHPLPLDVHVEHTWFEPPANGGRTPDSWDFSTPASIDATIELSGEMQGELLKVGDDGSLQSVATIPAGRGWRGWAQKLDPAHYRLQVLSARVNNDLAYTVAVRSEQLVAGLSRTVTAPAVIPLSVARSGILQLSSFGSADVRAELFDANGHLVASSDDGPDDWNFQLQKQLGAGSYQLHVDPVAPQKARFLGPQPTPARGSDDEDGDRNDEPADDSASQSTGSATCVVSMREPDDLLKAPLKLPVRTEAAISDSVLVYPIDHADNVDLLALQAESAEILGAAIDASADGNSWNTVGSDVGRTVRLATPIETNHRYRIRMWSLDGRDQSALLRAVAVRSTRLPESDLQNGATLGTTPGSDPPIAAASVELSRPGTFHFDDADDLRTASHPDELCTTSADGIVSSIGSRLWVVANPPSAKTDYVLHGTRICVGTGAGNDLQLQISGTRPAVTDLATSAGPILAVATTLAGQPGIRIVKRQDVLKPSGLGMAVAQRHAVTFAPNSVETTALVWAADGTQESSLVKLQQISFAPPSVEPAAWGISDFELNDVQARTFTLPPGSKELRLSLDAATVAALWNDQGVASVHWDGDQAFEEEVQTSAQRLTLLHKAAGPGRAHVELLPSGTDGKLAVVTAGTPLEMARQRAGTQRLEVGAQPGGKAGMLHVRGGRDGSTTFIGSDGQVLRGTDLPLRCDGTLLVPHAPGLLLAWEDYSGGSGQEVWGGGMVPEPQRIEAPATLALSGTSQAFWLKIGDPALVQLRMVQPTISLVRHDDGSTDTQLHSGATVVSAYAAQESVVLALRAVEGQSLSGAAELTATPVTPLHEGVGSDALLAAGSSRLYSFRVASAGPIGIGVRAEPDVVTATLRDARGTDIGRGVIQMPNLKPGAYLLEISTPADSGPVRVRPALVGIAQPSTTAPQDVIRRYMAMAAEDEPPPVESEEEEK